MESGFYFCFGLFGWNSLVFSPCIFPLLPVYIGTLLDREEPREVKFLGRKIAWTGLIQDPLFSLTRFPTVFFLLGWNF